MDGRTTEDERRERYEQLFAKYREALRAFKDAEARRAPLAELRRLQGQVRLHRVLMARWRWKLIR